MQEYECNKCLKKFENKTLLDIHNRKKKSCITFICENCNKKFSKKNILKKHLKECILDVKFIEDEYDRYEETDELRNYTTEDVDATRFALEYALGTIVKFNILEYKKQVDLLCSNRSEYIKNRLRDYCIRFYVEQTNLCTYDIIYGNKI